VCTAQSREILCVYCTVYCGIVYVLHCVDMYCVCTTLCKEVIGVCTVECREAQFVYSTV